MAFHWFNEDPNPPRPEGAWASDAGGPDPFLDSDLRKRQALMDHPFMDEDRRGLWSQRGSYVVSSVKHYDHPSSLGGGTDL